MPHVVLCPESLDEMDRMERDLLVLSYFSDERPLKGLNGLTDWRFNGRLSDMLRAGDLDGESGDQTLTTANNRLPTGRVLMFGLGAGKDFTNRRFTESVQKLFLAVSRMKAASCAMAIPGAHLYEDFLLERMAILLKEHRLRYSGSLLLFVPRNQNFKEMSAKFDLIRAEVEKIVPPKPKAARSRS